MKQWAKAPAPRHQLVLISQTCDDLVAEGHAVRLLDAILDEQDWGPWEAHFDGYRGQPPVHPRYIAGTILYGLIKGLRSSRDLEEATRERLDFKWFLEGRSLDHSTIAGFRTQFERQLKALNKAISRRIVERFEAAGLLELILDGTRVRANSDRNGARSAAGIEKLIAACAEQLDEKLAQLGREDAQEEEKEMLRRQVDQLKDECDKLLAALEEAQQRDAAKREIFGEKSAAVRVPLTDPDSTILPNKEGGFAPNYTPTVAVESRSGAIVSEGVVPGGDECQAIGRAVEDCEETLGAKPERFLADGAFASGKELERLETQGVESYMPVGLDLSEKNPANRRDPSQPVAEERRAELPRHGKQLDASAFVYDAANDQYYCPMGKILTYEKQGRYQRTGIAYRLYACSGKEGCPLAGQCVKEKAGHRSISRDQYQEVRERTARRMASAEGRAIYGKRAPSIEGVFGLIKQAMGVRQFLLRGLEKVRTEWSWICGAYNLKKMIRLMQEEQAGARC
jgi:transposase